MIEILLVVVFLAVGIFSVLYFLPQMPKWFRVGFWAALCISNIIQGDTFVAVIDAILATMNFYEDY